MLKGDINYDTKDTIYCYNDAPGVLINRFNIKNLEELSEAERDVTSLNLINFILQPVLGNFDFDHLKQIHYSIFSEIYEFAGNTRTVDISKGNTPFCYSQNITSQANYIFKNLNNETFKYMTEVDFFQKIAFYMGEINALHPFREGNGRAMREFFRLFCLIYDYELNYSNFTKEEVLVADINAFLSNYNNLINLFERGLLKKMNINNRFSL